MIVIVPTHNRWYENLIGWMFFQLAKQQSFGTTNDLFESLNKSEMWAAIQRSGTSLCRRCNSFNFSKHLRQSNLLVLQPDSCFVDSKAVHLIISCLFFPDKDLFSNMPAVAPQEWTESSASVLQTLLLIQKLSVRKPCLEKCNVFEISAAWKRILWHYDGIMSVCPCSYNL